MIASSERCVYLAALAVFAAAAALTLHFVLSMSGEMPMPGGWSMSMMWMPMAGESGLASAGLFAAMWLAMMIAMMLPSTLPMLILHRRVIANREDAARRAGTWLVGAGYFAVWLAFGLVAYGLGTATARAAMASDALARLVPIAAGAALVVAGIFQLTPWKSACLRHCRDPIHLLSHHLDRGAGGAVRLGLIHGVHCAVCCWGLMVVQLVVGVMSVPAMVGVAAVIAAEKLLPAGERIARWAGVLAIAGGIAVVTLALRRAG